MELAGSSMNSIPGSVLSALIHAYLSLAPAARLTQEALVEASSSSGRSLLQVWALSALSSFLNILLLWKGGMIRGRPERVSETITGSNSCFWGTPPYSTSQRSIEYLLTYVAYSRIGQTETGGSCLFVQSSVRGLSAKEPLQTRVQRGSATIGPLGSNETAP